MISGTPTTVAAAAHYTVTATHAGGSTTVDPSITVDARERTVFSANFSESSVSTHVTDSATGRLRGISKAKTGIEPCSVAVTSSGKDAYLANYDAGSILEYGIRSVWEIGSVSQYRIGSTGTLTAVGAPVTAGNGPSSVTTIGTWR